MEMVYRVLGVYGARGLSDDLESIWPRISKHDLRGDPRGESEKMRADALRHRLHAVEFGARDPVSLLRRAGAEDICLILSHRRSRKEPHGHFTVLTQVFQDRISAHDPERGPHRRVRFDELLELWTPKPGGETKKNLVLAIANRESPTTICGICGRAIPSLVTCPRCGHGVPLEPTALLGCLDPSCPGSNFVFLVCANPACPAND